jgi:hypothetical protein
MHGSLNAIILRASTPNGNFGRNERTQNGWYFPAKRKGHPATLGDLFFQGRIALTEFSSIRTFCGHLMSLKSIVSRKIYDLNTPVFNGLHNLHTA